MSSFYLAAIQLVDPSGIPKTNDNAIKVALTDIFVLLGAISILMIVIAGLRYILARGNADATAQAKNMITYSVMGLIIAALAASIVNFIVYRAG